MQSTPEYIRAHMSNLEPRFGSGDIARHNVETRARDRRERRARFSQHAAAIWRSLPFANNTAGTDSVASAEST